MYTQKGDIIILTWVVKSTNRKEKGKKKDYNPGRKKQK
jgi:hypothetical protein